MKARHLVPLLAFLLLCSACSALEPTTEEIESRLFKIAENIPSVTADEIVVSGSGKARSAVVTLTWAEKQGRFSTERSLDQYSRDFAEATHRRAPMIASLSLSWMVPYHSEEEAAMQYSYTRKKTGLVQTAFADRFTDGAFGADAFIDPDAKLVVPVDRTGTPEEPDSAAPEEDSQEAPEETPSSDSPDGEEAAE